MQLSGRIQNGINLVVNTFEVLFQVEVDVIEKVVYQVLLIIVVASDEDCDKLIGVEHLVNLPICESTEDEGLESSCFLDIGILFTSIRRLLDEVLEVVQAILCLQDVPRLLICDPFEV